MTFRDGAGTMLADIKPQVPSKKKKGSAIKLRTTAQPCRHLSESCGSATGEIVLAGTCDWNSAKFVSFSLLQP